MNDFSARQESVNNQARDGYNGRLDRDFYCPELVGDEDLGTFI